MIPTKPSTVVFIWISGECVYAFDTHLLVQEVCGYVGLDDASVVVWRRVGFSSARPAASWQIERGRGRGGELGKGSSLLVLQPPG